MAVLTQAELTAAVAALEWIGKRADLATVLNKMPAMQAAKKPPAVTKKMLDKAINFLKSKNGVAVQEARIAKGMKIKEWLQTGEFDGTAADTKVLLEEVCNMLDSACVAQITGSNLFRGADGRYYTVVVEAEIAEANDEFVQDVLQELFEEGEDDEETDEELLAAVDDGTAAQIEVEEVTVAGEKDGVPYPPRNEPPADDPDPRPGPRFGPPPGKPLAEQLDTAGATPMAELLDRVEEQAVAGADALDTVPYAQCKHCDHFVEPNGEGQDRESYSDTQDRDSYRVADYIHLCDEDHHVPDDDHEAEPRGPSKTLAEWRRDRPDLFIEHPDGGVGPNSRHHVTRLGKPGPTSPPKWEAAERILAIAAAARGFGVDEYRATLLEQIPTAWAEFSGWNLPTLKVELETMRQAFAAAGGRGVEMADGIDKMVMVVALREEGVESIDVLDLLNEESG